MKKFILPDNHSSSIQTDKQTYAIDRK